ncbi:condensation domain-containing protein [Paenibacillus sp. NPDC056933]|uniref:condensation domain-containing protein n=1 Tax=Paenibacillus sp. NPDC056933 TaxID=3345968 RepID=UPI00363B8B42
MDNTLEHKEIFPVEAQDMMNYIYRSFIGNQQISYVLKFEGRLDPNLLNEAIQITVGLQPILACRFVEDPVRPYWKKAEMAVSAEIRLGSLEESLDEAVASYIVEKNDFESGPAMRAALFRGSSDVLCIKIFHACCDAAGFKEYLLLLSEVYSQLNVGSKAEFACPYTGERSQQRLFDAVGIVDYQTMLNPKDMPEPTWGVPSQPGSNEFPHVSMRRLDKELFIELRNISKQKAVTINDLLVTAFYRGLFKVVDYDKEEETKEISLTVNLRRYLEDNVMDPVSNLSGMAYIAILPQEHEPFDQTLEKVVVALGHAKSDLFGIQPAIGMEMLSTYGFNASFQWLQQQSMTAIQSKKATPCITNFGTLSADTIYFGDQEVVDAYMIPPIIYSPHFALGANTYNNQLTLSVGYHQSSNNQETVNRFLDEVVASLTDWIESSIKYS